MQNKFPCIVPDRDRYRRWYLDEDVVHTLHNGDIIHIEKGYRFDGHSVPWPLHWFFPRYDTDIYAALVHDLVVDLAPWHRYNRAFIDREYTLLMQQHSYGLRRYWMPKAVWLYGFLAYTLWGDYRGEYKDKVRICVKVDVV